MSDRQIQKTCVFKVELREVPGTWFLIPAVKCLTQHAIERKIGVYWVPFPSACLLLELIRQSR